MIDAARIIESGTSILFVTLDSLRHDVAHRTLEEGRTPRLSQLLPGGQWERRQTPGTFTLPAHMAYFSGFLPKLPQPKQPPRLWECRPPVFKEVPPETFVFDAPSLLDGLALHGYRTVCVGGVTYFSQETPLGSVLPAMFHEAHWRPEFCSPEVDSTRHQVDQALAIADQNDGRRPLFLFVNVSARAARTLCRQQRGHRRLAGRSTRLRRRAHGPTARRSHRPRAVAGHHVRRPRRRLRRRRLPRPRHRPPRRVERAFRRLGARLTVTLTRHEH